MPHKEPHLTLSVAGPRGQLGILLVAPRTEALEWDLEWEITSTALRWMEAHKGWWIAYPYRDTLRLILERHFPCMK